MIDNVKFSSEKLTQVTDKQVEVKPNIIADLFSESRKELLKNVPAEKVEKYDEAKDILQIITSRYKGDLRCLMPVANSNKLAFSEERMLNLMSSEEKSLYNKYKSVITELEAQYPEFIKSDISHLLNARKETPQVSEKSSNQKPTAPAKTYDDLETSDKNKNDNGANIGDVAFQSALGSPLQSKIFGNDNLFKNIAKAALGFWTHIFD